MESISDEMNTRITFREEEEEEEGKDNSNLSI